MLINNIFILSREIRSGKTTELLEFLEGRTNIGGILTPDDEHGVRVMYDIAKKSYCPFELMYSDPAPAITVGKFLFAAAAFDFSRGLMAKNNNPGLFILDEIGKLEINRHEGFEPGLSAIINDYQEGTRLGMLLLVVRDSLLADAIAKYNLGNAVIISTLQDERFQQAALSL